MEHGPAFPEAGIVVVGRDLVEAELEVVIGTDPFGGVDGAAFKRRIDVAAGDLLRYDTQLFHDQAAHAADPHLDTLQVSKAGDLLAEPAAHLRTGIPARQAVDVLRGIELVHERHTATLEVPGVRAARVQAERNGGAKRIAGILAQ